MFIVACLALTILVYTYFVYPLLIAMCARIWPLQVHRNPDYTPSVSAIIPVYNAREFVAAKIDSLLAQKYSPDRFEIILLSDGSDDGSDELINAYVARYPERIRLFRSEKRSGKPSAINQMRREAKGDVLLMTDIRQPLHARCLSELVSHFADSEIGAVSGNLELAGADGAGVYWKYEKWIRRSEGGFRSVIGVTGAIYAVRAADLPDLPVAITLDDMWVPMRLRLNGKRIVFAANAVAYDEAFDDEKEFARKARTLAGNYQLFAALPELLLPTSNPSWFETMSHKVMRLVCPWALLVLIAVCVFSLATGWGREQQQTFLLMQILGAGQAVFYLAALAGSKAGKLGSVARTFVIMNYAALVGLWRFLRGSQRITW